MAYYLIFDQGGQSTRALVFDSRGNVVAESRAAIATSRGEGGVVEQDTTELEKSFTVIINEIAAALGDDIEKICSAGIVTQRSSLVCWNRVTRQALTPVIGWQDVRAKDQPELLSLDAVAVAAITGLRPSPHYGASKIRWCLQNLEQVKSALDSDELVCGPLASYVLFFLTAGRVVAVDPANGSRTLLWNCNSGQWDPFLLEHFQIAEKILPPLQPIKSRFGDVEIGGHSVPVCLLNGDQCAAFFGRGELEPGVVAVNAGTGAFIATLWPEDQPAPEGLLKTLVFDDGVSRQFVAEGTVNGAASALKWAAGSIEKNTLKDIDHWCREVCDPPLFLNGIGGLAAPFWVPDFESAFITEGGDEPELPARMVAVLESIVFLLIENLHRLQQSLKCNSIVLGGGLAESEAFCRKLASLSGLPVFHPAETELTARGAAFLLADKPGDWQQQEGVGYQPEPDKSLSMRYSRWQQALEARLDHQS